MEPLHPEILSWTALLGKWIDFAKASVALPDDEEGEKWKRSVVPIINLQAVTFALADLGVLDEPDRPLARDRAEILIAENASALETIWTVEELPESLAEIARDAMLALGASEQSA